jgi:glycosyltransferase involved in cell wall biosynthesis
MVALSEHVKRQLIEQRGIPSEKMRVLFHPRLGRPGPPREDAGLRPNTFLFFGRILRYKGLPLFVQACEILRREGFDFRILVAGEGDLGEFSGRLAALGAEVINRWVTHEEAGALMARSDAAVVPSIEASQSGVVALAHGSGVPVIATPVGGLVEQVSDGVTGLLADAVSATSVAAAMRRFLQEPELRDELAAALARSSEFSMRQFVEAIAKLD